MRITIDNIGHVEHADIEVNSITVIAGNNNTGKSTVGKALYATATGLNLLEPAQILEDKAEGVILRLTSLFNIIEMDEEKQDALGEIRRFCLIQNFGEMSAIDNAEQFDKEFSNVLLSQLDLFFKSFDEQQDSEKQYILRRLHKDIEKFIQIPIDDKKFRLNIMQKVFDMEFSQQISHLNNPNKISKICVKELNQKEILLTFKEHNILDEETNLDISRPFSKAIYIDNPFILDQQAQVALQFRNQHEHTVALKKILFGRENLYESNLFDLNVRENKIEEIFNYVMDEGKVLKRGGRHYFESSNIKSPLAIQNLSTGLKSFTILNILLKSKHLNKCEYIILDEPEIHLHPDWQLSFAELVVLMSKEFNLKIIVTSHSPYFIEAIELFSKKHSIFNGVKFYKTVQIKDSNRCIIKDTTSNVSNLFDDLAKAFYTLEQLRDEVETDGDDNDDDD